MNETLKYKPNQNLLSNKMGIIIPEVRLQSRLNSLFGAAKAALPVWLILLLSDWEPRSEVSRYSPQRAQRKVIVKSNSRKGAKENQPEMFWLCILSAFDSDFPFIQTWTHRMTLRYPAYELLCLVILCVLCGFACHAFQVQNQKHLSPRRKGAKRNKPKHFLFPLAWMLT